MESNTSHEITFPRNCDDARCKRCGAHFSTIDLIKIKIDRDLLPCEGEDDGR